LKPVETQEKHGRTIEKKENILQLQGVSENIASIFLFWVSRPSRL
jgi:hypothetical protein